MACTILHDPEQHQAVFFCTTTGRSLNHEAFVGPDAREQAEDFLDWSDDDPRRYPVDGYTLDQMIGLWKAEAFDDPGGDDEVFIGHKRVRVVT